MRTLFWIWVFFVSCPFVVILLVRLGLELAFDGIIHVVGKVRKAAATQYAAKE